MRRARWKRKNVSAGRPAWMRTSCRRRGMVGTPARQSGTETPGPWGILWPGEIQGYLLPLFPLPLTLPRRTRQRLAKRKARKEKQIKSVYHPDDLRTLRHGSAVTRIAEGHSVPEGQAKSEQAPVRRPPSARRHERAGARLSALFFWTVHGPFSFPQDGKENGGCIPAGQAPLAGARPPRPPQRRPMRLRGRLPQCRKIQSRWSLRPSR